MATAVATRGVKDYVRIAKGRRRETFAPLVHPPGHAQVDFGEAIGVIGGVRQKLHVFFMDRRHYLALINSTSWPSRR